MQSLRNTTNIMEVILFNREDKKAKSAPTKPIKGLIAIYSPSELLSQERRVELINRIEKLSTFTAEPFESLCLVLIQQLANYYQSLPETANSFYTEAGGMLDLALIRTEAAIELFMQYAIMQDNDTLSDIQKLWLYALITASLLKDIGKLQIDFRINIFDNVGQLQKAWNPLIETMSSIGQYYQFEFEADSEEKTSLRQRLNVLLARQLMPKSGFEWIASNPAVLAAWLALLNDDWQGGKTLGAILVRADAAAIQRYFNEMILPKLTKQGGRKARIGTFTDTIPDSNMNKEQLTGIAFIKWLQQSLGSGNLVINKSPLFMVPGGMLIGTEAFKQFVQSHPEYKNWQAVQSGFLSLGLHKTNPDGSVSSRFEQSKTQQMHTGILFSNYAIALPVNVKMQNLYTGAIAPMSALELIHLAQLNHAFTRHFQQPTPKETLQALTMNGEWKAISHATLLQSRPMKSV